jgi:hypothetical protein
VTTLKTIQRYRVAGATELPEPESCTSIKQKWHVPRGKKIAPVPTRKVVVAKPKEDATRKRKPVIGDQGFSK